MDKQDKIALLRNKHKPELGPHEVNTFAGLVFNYLNPTPHMISVKDIVNGLSREGRWANQSPYTIPVAAHSLFCYYYAKFKMGINDRMILSCILLHDSPEAYCRDIPGPLKQLIPRYKEIEENILDQICTRFNLLYPLPQVYKDIDIIAQSVEFKAKEAGTDAVCVFENGHRFQWFKPEHLWYRELMHVFKDLDIK